MNYMQIDLPQNAVVYELSEEELGTSRFERRFMSLKDRTAIVKIMNIEDKQFMFRVLDRPDIKILSPSGVAELQENAYFIALNNFERRKVESEYNLTRINEFRRTYDSAAIYRLNSR